MQEIIQVIMNVNVGTKLLKSLFKNEFPVYCSIFLRIFKVTFVLLWLCVPSGEGNNKQDTGDICSTEENAFDGKTHPPPRQPTPPRLNC